MFDLLIVVLAALCLVLLGIIWWQARRLRFHRLLAALDEAVGALADPTEFERGLLAAMVQAAEADAGLFYSQAPGPAGLRLRAACGLEQAALAAVAGDSWLRDLLAEIASAREAEITQSLDRRLGFLANYAAVLAMRLPGPGKRPAGVAFLLRRRSPFARERLRVLERFAPRAAVALARAQLCREHVAAAEENARLYVSLSRFRRTSTLDELTGLPNQHYLRQRLKEEMKKSWRFGQPLSVVLLDLDFFHRINEEHGREIGDEVLCQTARLIRGAVRDYDVVGRYGGEEFLLVLPQTDLQGALALAERLGRAIAEHAFPAGARLTCSLGVISLGSGDLPSDRARDRVEVERVLEELLARVGEALLRAKDGGRNRIEVAAVDRP